jgi:hypothetical protein
MKRVLLPLFAIVALVLFAVWWFSPKQVVKRRTQTLLRTLTLDSSTGTGTRQAGTYSLNALLAQEVELETTTLEEASGTFERDELESAYSWLCGQAKQTRFEMVDLQSVSVEDEHAKVEFLLNALVELPGSRPVDGRFDVTFHWRRSDDGWRLERAIWEESP